MIIKDSDAVQRLNSPMNLMNRLSSLHSEGKRNNAMSLFMGSSSEKKTEKEVVVKFNPFENKAAPVENSTGDSTENHPSLDTLVPNNNEQVRLSLAHDAALDVLNSAVGMLRDKLEDVKADRLPSVITATSKVVESIRRERLESAKSGINKEVHYHFYTPEQKKISDYEVIDVG